MPDFIERQECPECGASPKYLGRMHEDGCSGPAYATVRYVRERHRQQYADLEAVRKALRYECEAAADDLIADVDLPHDGPHTLAITLSPWLVDVIRAMNEESARDRCEPCA